MFWWIFAASLAYFVKGLCGFGNTLVFSSLLAFTENNAGITPVELLIGVPTNPIVIWKYRKSLQPKLFLPLIGLVIAGSIPGALLLQSADAKWLKLAFGLVTLLISGEMLYRLYRPASSQKSGAGMVLIALFSGLLCGLYGIGAPLSAYVSRKTKDAQSFKANLCMVFFAENLFRVGLYSFLGIINLEILKQSLLLLPFTLGFLLLGLRLSRSFSEKTAKKIVVAMLMLSGLMLIVNNWPV